MNKRIVFSGIFACLVLFFAEKANAQVYAKLNAPYALVGLINPSVEFGISPKSTFQADVTYSPWQSIKWKGVGRPMHFLIFQNEYRRYFKSRNDGLYVGGNAGIMTFRMTKPTFGGGKLGLKNTFSKGYGFMLGLLVGYEWRLGDKWIMDAFVGFAWMNSNYNAYALVDGVVEGGRVYNKGDVIMTPGMSEWGNKRLDPFNGSGEFLPNKIGLSFGRVIFDPQKRREKNPLL